MAVVTCLLVETGTSSQPQPQPHTEPHTQPQPRAQPQTRTPAARTQAPVKVASPRPAYVLTPEADRFLEDLSKRSFLFFWEQTDPATGLVRDRARTDGSPPGAQHRDVGSIASTGFGLAGLCIAAERGWVPRDALVARARTTVAFFAERAYQNHGWFYHWLNIHTGEREWKSEVSSIDTALLMGGVLSVRQCFRDDPAIVRHAEAIYRRLDFGWMLDGHPALLSHGWHPETGFIRNRWAEFSEAMILYILGLGSPTFPLPAASWAAWGRPQLTYGPYTYVTTVPPLFLHQYSHAWVDFRGWRDPVPPQPDWYANSVLATRAQRQFCVDVAKEFPGYSDNVWGITASDTRKGYKAWGGPPRDPDIDGSVVPCAAAGSLMIAPDIAVPAVLEMHRRFGDRIYGKYGFADAFHPTDGWVNPDVIGIDVGITLLSAENLRSGRVWQWFMANEAIPQGMRRAGMTYAAAEVAADVPAGVLAGVPTDASATTIRRPSGAAIRQWWTMMGHQAYFGASTEGMERQGQRSDVNAQTERFRSTSAPVRRRRP